MSKNILRKKAHRGRRTHSERVISLLFAFVITSTSFLGLFFTNAPTAKADDETNLAKLCLPPLKEYNSDRTPEGEGGNNDDPTDGKAEFFYPTGNWLSIDVISRAAFEIKIVDNTSTKCKTPNMSASIIAEKEGPGSFGRVVNGVVYDRQLDETFNYRYQVKQGVSRDESLIHNFGSYPGSSKIDTARIGKLDSSALTSFFKEAEVVISIEEDSLPTVGGCSTDQDMQFTLKKDNDRGDGGKMDWNCEGNDEKTKGNGISIANVITNPNNFNIVYAVSSDAKTLVHVSEKEQDDWNFEYCKDVNGEDEFRTNCSGDDYLRIKRDDAFFLQNTENENIEETVYKKDGSVAGTVVIAGANTRAAKYTSGDSIEIINTGGAGQSGDSCESKVDFVLSYLICPGLALADQALVWLDDAIVGALGVDSANYEKPELKKTWGEIRNIAYIVLIPVMLLMVIGTALQFSFVDAYTVKRALPRLFMAVIFIALSYDIAALMIEIVNVIGQGIAGIIAGPFGGMKELTLQRIFAPDSVNNTWFTGGVIAGVGIAAFSGVTVMTLFSALGMAALALLIIFLLLSIRELLLVFLLVISPLAIITWIFPGNDKFWKLWWGTFTKLLLLYPIIMGLLATGRAFASFVGTTGDGDIIVLNTIVKLVAFIGPYFFIPKAFEMAGGAFANLAGMANNRGKGIFDRQKKWRADQRKDARQRNLSGNRFRNAPKDSWRAKINKGLQTGALVPQSGYRPSRIKAAKRLMASEELDHVAKDPSANAVLANDDASQALLHGRGTLQGKIDYLMNEASYSADDATQIAQELQLLERKHGGESLKAMAVIQLAGSKTAFRGGPAEMAKSILEAAEGDTQVAASLYAKARSAAEQAGRTDLAGYSYGEGLVQFQQIWNADDTAVDPADGQTQRQRKANEVNTYLINKVIDSKGAGQLLSSHGTSVKNVAVAMGNRVATKAEAFNVAAASGDAVAAQNAHRELMFALAESANGQDAASQISPENGREFANEVLNREIEIVGFNGESKVVSIQDFVDSSRNNKNFQQRRREYGVNEAAARGAGGGDPGATGAAAAGG